MNIKAFLRDKDNSNLLTHISLAFLIKGLALVVSMFSMPLYIKYFDNNEVLGLWYTILSLMSWIQLCDLGLGNGLRNNLTRALTLGNLDEAKKYIASTYMALTLIITPVFVICCVVFRFWDLNTFFNVSNAVVSKQTLYVTVCILFGGICCSFVLKTINIIFYAVQKSSFNNLLSFCTSVLPLVYIALFKGDTLQHNLVSLTIVHALSTNLPLLLATFLLFRSKSFRAYSPKLMDCSFHAAKKMLNLGLLFFSAQILFMFITSTNEIIITKIFSTEKVVEYSIYFRLFTVIGSLFMLALTPLWSQITKDLAQKKYKRIRRTNYILYGLSAFALIIEFTIVFVLQFLVNIWLGDESIPVDRTVGFIFAFYGSMYILNVVLTTVANGIGNLWTQILFYGIGSVFKIPGIYALSSITNHWSAVVLYNALVLFVFCIFQFFWIERFIQKNLLSTAEDN